MKLPLFLILTVCVSEAVAYGLYGCYERLLYWQAYQMDSGSKIHKIAVACSRDAETAKHVGPVTGGRCNLRQFLYYITSDEGERSVIADKNKLKDADLAKDQTALDELAKKMDDVGIGKAYMPGRIYQGLRVNSGVDKVISNVAAFIEQKGWLEEDNGKPSQTLFDLAEKARSRVEFGRKAMAARDIGNEVRKQYDREVWDRQPKNKNGEVKKNAPLVEEGLVKESLAVPEGGVGGWRTCDLEVAQNSVNAAEAAAGRGPVNLKKDFVRPWREREATHLENIRAASKAKAKITSCSG
ncbi:hypothetical protein AbraIFM66951_008734 [Aspergillus brasiliensis]|nr:hypothetical protein AbraIFM66951_008734 [Aspergillus brasiliensis]